MTAHEKRLVRRAEKFAAVDEVRHDKTDQRLFEQSFLSLEQAEEDGLQYDYSDGCRQMRAIVRKLDEPYWNRVRELRFWNALYKLRDYPELQTTLRAIRRYRVRRKIFSALQIKAGTYRERFSQLTKILQIPNCILEGCAIAESVRDDAPLPCEAEGGEVSDTET